jgi:hypothetical protein
VLLQLGQHACLLQIGPLRHLVRHGTGCSCSTAAPSYRWGTATCPAQVPCTRAQHRHAVGALNVAKKHVRFFPRPWRWRTLQRGVCSTQPTVSAPLSAQGNKASASASTCPLAGGRADCQRARTKGQQHRHMTTKATLCSPAAGRPPAGCVTDSVGDGLEMQWWQIEGGPLSADLSDQSAARTPGHERGFVNGVENR